MGELCYLKAEEESMRKRFNIHIQFCSYLEAYNHAINRCGAGKGTLVVSPKLMKIYRVRKNDTGYYTKQSMDENRKCFEEVYHQNGSVSEFAAS